MTNPLTLTRMTIVVGIIALSLIARDACAFAPLVPTITRGIIHHPLRFATTKHQKPRKRFFSSPEDEVEGNPLEDGAKSISWLPSVSGAYKEIVYTGNDQIPSGGKEETLPLFPLGSILVPKSEKTLTIFEPRYCQLYEDIAANKSKRLVVTMVHPDEPDRFAHVGVLLEVLEMKDLTKETANQIKYECSHRVLGRVKISKILNPSAWESGDTYLKAKGVFVDDASNDMPNDVYGAVSEVAQSAPEVEKNLVEAFTKLTEIQHELEESVRFSKEFLPNLKVGPSPDEGLWQFLRLWDQFAGQRLIARESEINLAFQEKLFAFLQKTKGYDKSNMPSVVSMNDLSPSLQKEFFDSRKQTSNELEPLMVESNLMMQKILEAKDHKTRCQLSLYFIEAEIRRLKAKKALKGMAEGLSADNESPVDPETIRALSEDFKKGSNVSPDTTIFDEPDAFQ